MARRSLFFLAVADTKELETASGSSVAMRSTLLAQPGDSGGGGGAETLGMPAPEGRDAGLWCLPGRSIGA